MSREMNGKIFGGLIAAAVAVGGGTYAYKSSPTVTPPAVVTKQERPTYQPRAADARSWGGLSSAELQAFNAGIAGLEKSKVHIFCGGNYCRDLAEDLDEAFESAGFDAYLETPLFDIGKGVGVSPANDRTRAIAKAISDATTGRVILKVFDPLDQDGKAVAVVGNDITIALARKAAK